MGVDADGVEASSEARASSSFVRVSVSRIALLWTKYQRGCAGRGRFIRTFRILGSGLAACDWDTSKSSGSADSEGRDRFCSLRTSFSPACIRLSIQVISNHASTRSINLPQEAATGGWRRNRELAALGETRAKRSPGLHVGGKGEQSIPPR